MWNGRTRALMRRRQAERAELLREALEAAERQARLEWRGALMQVLQAQLALRAELRQAAKVLARPV